MSVSDTEFSNSAGRLLANVSNPLTLVRLQPLKLLDRAPDTLPNRDTLKIVLREQRIRTLCSGEPSCVTVLRDEQAGRAPDVDVFHLD